MIVALPFCHKDEHLALLNLEWCLKLDGGQVPFECVLTVDDRTEPDAVQASAQQYFQSVRVCRYPFWSGNPNWPAPHNHAWQQTARYFDSQPKGQPWLWWEADATPLAKGWLTTLQTAYEQGAKPFAGHWVTGNNGHAYMNGVGIYPPRVNRFDTASYLAHQASFDIVLGPRLATNCHRINHLIAHSLQPLTFSTVSEIWETTGKEAVLFHNCKDGSIVKCFTETRGQKIIAAVSNVITAAKEIFVEESPITVVITNWKRPDKVKAAFHSCLEAGVQHIVVTASAVDEQLAAVHKSFKMSKSDVVIDAIDEDRGCNEMWLRGVRLAKTPWVHILHDDDKVLPAFGKLREPVGGFSHWNGAKHWSQADTSTFPNLTGQIYDTFPGRRTGTYPTDDLWRFLLNPKGLTLSPVAGLFRKEHLIEVLEEAETAFRSDQFHYRPTLMVGNDLLIWLRAVEKYPTFDFYHEPKISYGHWDGSCSFEDAKTGRTKLLPIYSAARQYFYEGPPVPTESPDLIHLHSLYPGSGQRERDAMGQWWQQYHQGNWLCCPVSDWQLPRLFSDDKRRVPYLKDLIDYAFKMPGEICVLSNLDVIPIGSLTRHLLAAFDKHPCCYSYRRDFDQFRVLTPLQIRLETRAYAGLDLFALTRGWWAEHRNDLPDLVYAAECWDYCLKTLMDATGGKPFYYLIYHVAHQPESIRNKDSAAQKHNRKLAGEFLKQFKIEPYWETGIPIKNPR